MEEKMIFHERYNGEFNKSYQPVNNYALDRSQLCYNNEKLSEISSLREEIKKIDPKVLSKLLIKGVALQLTIKYYFTNKKAVLMANLNHLFNFCSKDNPNFTFCDINGAPGKTQPFLFYIFYILFFILFFIFFIFIYLFYFNYFLFYFNFYF